MRLLSCCVYFTGIACVLLLITGISMVLTRVFQNLVHNTIKQQIILENGTEAFSVWESPPPPVYMQFYFFNLTNPEEVLKGDRPFVEQIGPYTYREYRPKVEVKFMDNDTRVDALNPKTYVFQLDMSRGPEDELVRTVNIPALTVMTRFKDSMLSRIIADLMKWKSVGLFGTYTVRDLLWGYEDPLLKALQTFVKLDDHFGLFYQKNGTDDGDYIFLTGKQNYQDFARIDEWSGQRSLSWWNSSQCNMINGTDGSSFHPLIEKTERLYIFSSDLCRSLYALYESEVTVQGVPALRFVPPAEVFANTSINPDNAGFCVPAGHCLGSGLLNVSVCKEGAPIIMSSPHFYQADPKFAHDIYGMNPIKEEHETFVDLNPVCERHSQMNRFIAEADWDRAAGSKASSGQRLHGAAGSLQVSPCEQHQIGLEIDGYLSSHLRLLMEPDLCRDASHERENGKPAGVITLVCVGEVYAPHLTLVLFLPVSSQTENIQTLVFPVMYINESVLIDQESARKLRAAVTDANIVINIPFMVISAGILLGIIFIILMCRLQGPPSTKAERQPLLSS
ncbi:hypothetical protein DNTS_032786 [Danionella cerebrum]|uniref:Scavenger receptor class B member 2 n=1 Tax=Danionella cerebrum TaxID=2873325 RepID=A0A553R4N0_9TELE|nr:hypothetical protein DNTS_032786 [Danionella translucida]